MVDDKINNLWARPNEIAFSSATANEIFIACGDWSGRRCGMLARYEEHVVFFNATMDDKMTYSMFEEIAIYLDDQISNRLYP